MIRTLNRIVAGACALASGQLSTKADWLFDFARTKTESKAGIAVYDLPGFTGSSKELFDRLREALDSREDDTFVKEELVCADPPRSPGTLTVGPFAGNPPVAVNVPSCEGLALPVASSDRNTANWGDSAHASKPAVRNRLIAPTLAG